MKPIVDMISCLFHIYRRSYGIRYFIIYKLGRVVKP